LCICPAHVVAGGFRRKAQHVGLLPPVESFACESFAPPYSPRLATLPRLNHSGVNNLPLKSASRFTFPPPKSANLCIFAPAKSLKRETFDPQNSI
jgi:hypothetical protein